MDSAAANALAERIGEMIEEFSECNTITVSEVLQALEFTYACVERHNENATPWRKMH